MLNAGKPLGEAPVVVILVHGRGAGPENILDLVPAIGRADVTYLAPAAANRTWYPYSFMSDIAKNEPYLSSALSVLVSLVARVEAAGIDRDHIVLLAASRRGRASRPSSRFATPRDSAASRRSAAAPSGRPGRHGTNRAAGFDGTPIFFGCSDVDPHIPEPRVRESADVCARMGADVTTRIYPGMGHLVNDDEIDWLQSLLDALISKERG